MPAEQAMSTDGSGCVLIAILQLHCLVVVLVVIADDAEPLANQDGAMSTWERDCRFCQSSRWQAVDYDDCDFAVHCRRTSEDVNANWTDAGWKQMRQHQRCCCCCDKWSTAIDVGEMRKEQLLPLLTTKQPGDLELAVVESLKRIAGRQSE
jgi:hypothetical protein